MSGAMFTGVVAGGQTVTVGPGQTASQVQVQAGRTLIVDAGGVIDDLQAAQGATVVDGGRIDLVNGDVAYGVDVQAGGTLDVTSGATVYNTIVGSGGEEIVTDDVSAPYGFPNVDEVGVANNTQITVGSVIEVRGFGDDSTTFAFFSGGDLIVRSGVGRYDSLSHYQTISGNQPDYFLDLGYDPAVSALRLEVACYVSGTAIATEGAEQPVERLAPGDRVRTASGQAHRVRWVGRRSYAGRFLAANPALQPVRFRAGSLGAGLPRRDLWVSSNHSMYLDGVLIPARCLVNGTTIVWERDRKQVD